MTHQAKGSFDVQLAPQAAAANEAKLPGRMLIEKQFRGDLAARSRGQMLAAMSEVKGSAGYVAIEQVTGTLGDRGGSFVLQHSGTMTRGVPQLLITVVPDSGTGQLRGLRGSMTIDIVDGKHFYTFDYSFVDLPEN